MIKKIQLYIIVALLIIGLTAAFFSFIDSLLDNFYLKKDFAYTVSYSVSIGTPSRAGNSSKYTFLLKGQWYRGYTNLPLHRDGTKYFIKFYPKNPNRNRATKVIANPEDIRNLPPYGYKELPHK